ncbi:MAG TPA: PAS domain S-box protein [Gemmatimonadaceae bacterium]|jgi:PAS domain S-box-containing protein|nr:PAS domain S-box protein [Gemmatimonadaceae bacterium]
MRFRDTPIQRKLMTIVLLTSGAVLLLTCAAFFAYEIVTFPRATIRQLSTLGEIVATNSTAALAFDNQQDAAEVLSALKAEPHITAAALYDQHGALFATFPAGAPASTFPRSPGGDGHRFEQAHLITVQPVVQNARRLGTLYLQSDMEAMYQRFRLYGGIAVVVMAVSFLLAYLLSRTLQGRISHPILALAETARAVSTRGDYSVRATKLGEDELGVLTDCFNQMLTQIQEQTHALSESEARVRAVLNSALSAVVVIDEGGTVTDWNAQAETMFGWTREEALGRELATLMVPDQYRAAHRSGLRRFVATREGPLVNRLIEMTAVRRDGGEFPVELSISPLVTGDTVTFCGFITDITERKQAETKVQAQLERLDLLNRITRAIVERQDLTSMFAVILQNLEENLEENLAIDCGCVCLYDAAAETLTVTSVGTRSRALATELGITEGARVPIDQNGLSRCVRGHLVYEPDVAEVPFPFPQRLARGGLHAIVAAPLLVDGRVFGVLLIARRQAHSFSSGDCEFLQQLTAHAALAAHQATLYGALQQAYDDLRQTQRTVMQQERLRALGEMASGIAHDINNAITPAALYTALVLEREANLSGRGREDLVTIQRAIEDVAQTVARMREFYRPREPQLLLAPIELNRMVQQVVELTRARWRDLPQERGVVIQLRTELAPELPSIMGAEGEIRDALTNLVFNAVDAMTDGGRLTIRTSVVASQHPSGESDAGTTTIMCGGDRHGSGDGRGDQTPVSGAVLYHQGGAWDRARPGDGVRHGAAP